MSRRLTVEADGGSRGNPGVAGYGALVRDTDTGALLAERAAPLGKASNNVAEYRGLIAGLEAARSIDPGAEVLVRMDSKLVVEQMSGTWKIKHEDMRRLALQAQEVARSIRDAGGSVRYTWIPRAENSAADALSNDGMDGRTVDRDLGAPPERTGTAGASGSPAPPATTPTRVLLVAAGEASAARRAAEAVEALLGGGPRYLLEAGSPDATETAAEIADVLRVEPVVDPGWAGAGDVAAAWDRVAARGGTTVVVCPAEVVQAVLAHVLGTPPERAGRLVVDPGSLTGLEVDGDLDVAVNFTNRA
ncbi:reverse transcriptase-like protein [Phycicoccus endophyticus]|uniref:Reverse transcriptase-like protein n=1 Tax=Phycicoccus endophyticus TaxID=1690220 RepID=A0A7G9R405_9MICO|nr:reverse transcriptase-like protein [Phycicoccus endophyticus]NHI18169.1 reverse transcriptase-like protein [Phycicoccus endophyticus]QNN50330.1 reverse transcriptase-like protein [Phycicoccus endophyticus]GGL25921.1 hypothetical protein GCM10012283_05090 [Phycicoccus endophyticus]